MTTEDKPKITRSMYEKLLKENMDLKKKLKRLNDELAQRRILQ